jgi:tetratricopeptide (TPR) repeat protein
VPKNKGKYRSRQGKVAAPVEQFQSLTHRVFQVLRPHAVKLLSVAAGVTIVLVGFSLWTYFQDRKESNATKQFAQVIAKQQAPVEGDFDLTRGAPDPTAPKYRTANDRTLAALAEADALEAQYGSAEVGVQGLLVKAALAYDLGRWDEAIASYQRFLSKAPKVPQLQVLAREGIGFSYEAKALAEKDAAAREAGLKHALEAYGQIETNEKSPFFAEALYHQGRITELLGDPKGAAALFRRAQEKNPPREVAAALAARLTTLPAPPEAPASQPASAPAAPAPASQPSHS